MTTPLLSESPLARMTGGLDACVHCGFCLQACPTYINLEDENDSPRGRIVLMRRLLEGDIALDDPDAGRHIDRCLGCRACETACPSGVPYGELLEATRATTRTARGTPLVARFILAVFANRYALRAALVAARAFRATGLPRVAARILPPRLAFPFGMLASTQPAFSRKGLTNLRFASSHDKRDAGTVANAATTSATTTLLEGCVMRGLLGHVNEATERVLQRSGYRVVATQNQNCCGALHAHAGDLEGARELARANITAFERAFDEHGIESIAINSAGCSAMIKQYGHLLHDDVDWAARAERVSRSARDVSELLYDRVKDTARAVGTIDNARRSNRPRVRVAHDPPCHQMHAQRIVREPLALLNSIDGLELVPLEDADQCCGSAGIYNLLEPETSDAVLAPKLKFIAAAKVEYLATGNPGCMMQIGAGLLLSGSATKVVHPIQLIDQAYNQSK